MLRWQPADSGPWRRRKADSTLVLRLGEQVLEDFDESVDLPEFRLHSSAHLAVGRGDAQPVQPGRMLRVNPPLFRAVVPRFRRGGMRGPPNDQTRLPSAAQIQLRGLSGRE